MSTKSWDIIELRVLDFPVTVPATDFDNFIMYFT
jgi:hypothetical protein